MPTRVKHQAIKLYDSTETLFNDKTSLCEWHEDYFPTVTCDDTSQIIINNEVFIEDAGVDSGFDHILSGTITNDGALTAIIQDSSASFITNGVTAGMYLMAYTGGVNGNTNDGNEILSVDSETQVTVALAFTPTESQYYEISEWSYFGDIRAVNNYLEVKNTAPTVSDSGVETTIKNDTVYKVEFTVTFINPDAPASNIYVSLGGNEILKVFAEDIEGRVYTAYGISTSTTFSLRVDGNPIISIDDIIISEMYHTDYSIKKCSDDSVKYNSTISDFVFSQTMDQLRMDVEWVNAVNGYACEGCYYIDIDQTTDQDENLDRISNGGFVGSTDWNFGTNWILSGGGAFFTGVLGSGNLSQTSLANNFTKGVDYTITLDVLSGFFSGSFNVSLYLDDILVVDLGDIATTGSQSLQTGALPRPCDEIRFTPTSESNTYTLDNISAIITEEATQYNYRTDCFNLTEDLDCMVKLSGTNFDNAFGIDFNGLVYNPFIRVAGELTTPSWDGDRENEEDSLGVSKTLYFKSETKRDLFLYQLPLFHHDFIRLLIGYDRLLVDDVEYIAKEASYEPESERILGKLPDLSNSTTELRLREDLNENKFC